MPLKLKSADELDALGINPADLANLKAQLRADPKSESKCPSLGHLIEDAKTLRVELRKQTAKARKEAHYLTALHWRYGATLKAIKKQYKHGEWLHALVTIGEVDRQGKANRRRAREYIRYTTVFATEALAGKKTVAQANKLICKLDNSPYANCFATPDWLREAIEREFGLPGLDACASHGKQFGEVFFAPKDNKAGRGAVAFDGLKQDWSRFCPKEKIIFCNPPFNRAVLALWVKMCWEAAQKGYTVICLLPQWERDDWYQQYVKKYGEVRHAILVAMMGFGPKKGKRSGGEKWETVVVIFRKEQSYCEGPSFRQNQPSMPNLGGVVAEQDCEGARRTSLTGSQLRGESEPSKEAHAVESPTPLGRMEVIDRLVAELNRLDLVDLAYWWERIIGSPCFVEGDRLYQPR